MWVRSLYWKIPWMRAWQPTPVFLPGEFHGQRSLEGYSPWGHTELNTTEVTQHISSIPGPILSVVEFSTILLCFSGTFPCRSDFASTRLTALVSDTYRAIIFVNSQVLLFPETGSEMTSGEPSLIHRAPSTRQSFHNNTEAYRQAEQSLVHEKYQLNVLDE